MLTKVNVSFELGPQVHKGLNFKGITITAADDILTFGVFF